MLLLSLMTITKSWHTSLSWSLSKCEAVSLLSWVDLLVLAMVGVVGVVLSSHLILLVVVPCTLSEINSRFCNPLPLLTLVQCYAVRCWWSVTPTPVRDDGVQNQAHEILLYTPYLGHYDGGLLTKVVVSVVGVAALLWPASHSTPLLAI